MRVIRTGASSCKVRDLRKRQKIILIAGEVKMRNKGEERRKIDEIRKKTIEKNRKGKGKKERRKKGEMEEES